MFMVLGGSRSSVQQVRTSLASAGFSVQPSQHGWGLVPERDDEAFVTVEGPDVNKAHECASAFGWRLRSHWEKSEPTVDPDGLLTPQQRLERVERDLLILKSIGVSNGG